MRDSSQPKRFLLSWKYQLLLWIGYWLYSSIQTLPFYEYFLSNLGTEGIFTLATAICVYINLFFLIPRLLIPKKYLWFTLAVLGITLTIAWITNELFAFFLPVDVPFFSSWQGKLVLFTDSLLIIALTSAIHFLWKWQDRDRYAKELEKQNIETELALLKSQVNPHFVFNILNAIYHLISKDKGKAQDLLLQFSDILSHQIYDSGKDIIPLEKELNYLKNYIEIEKARSEDLMALECSFPENVNGYGIAPMLMLPLVENAFKHSKKADGYQVDIHLKLEKETLSLDIHNSLNENKNEKTHGLGLTNVKRRLELLYPDKHEFSTQKTEDTFITQLKIKLNETQVSDH